MPAKGCRATGIGRCMLWRLCRLLVMPELLWPLIPVRTWRMQAGSCRQGRLVCMCWHCVLRMLQQLAGIKKVSIGFCELMNALAIHARLHVGAAQLLLRCLQLTLCCLRSRIGMFSG